MTATAVELGYPPDVHGRVGPTAKQAIAHTWAAWVDEVLYGGAAGGGKTDWLIAETLRTLFEWPGITAGIFRRRWTELTQAEGIVPRLLVRIPRTLGAYNGSAHVWTFRPAAPGYGVKTVTGAAYTSKGSELHLGHVARDDEVANYLGAEYALQAWDQLEAHTEWQFVTLQSRLRVPRAYELAGLRPRAIASANPGGRGHGWLKRRFIDPAPPMVVWQPNPTEQEPAPGTRLFVPALLDDNPHIGPSYERRLENLDPDRRRAWRYGDWDVLGGTRFSAFRRALHVIDPGQLPVPLSSGVPKALGVDYGITAPFCALWGALFPGNPPLVVVYRELYKAELTPKQQAELILASERHGERAGDRPLPAFVDPSTFRRGEEGPKADPLHPHRPPPGSIAARYAAAGLPVRRANNDRLAGAAAVDQALRLHTYDDGNQLPGLLIYSTCLNLIRTLPELQRDDKNPEDVDSDGSEDHAYDALRYLLGGLGRVPNRANVPDEARSAAEVAAGVGRNITAGLSRSGF